MTDHSIWVLEYARAPGSPACFLIHGEPGTRDLPYSMTVLQSAERTILVDTGFLDQGQGKALGEIDGITLWAHPRDVLGRIGIAPEDVDAIVITHAHYDHLGDVAAYPNAEVWIQRRELERWRWAFSLPDAMQWLKDGVSTDDLDATDELLRAGRVHLVDGAAAGVLPGIDLEPDVDTHTYGHQHVVVTNEADGRWVLPGDDVYTYVNVEGRGGDGRYVPIGYATGSQENGLMAIDRMVRAVEGATNRILPGHDVELWERHPSVAHADGLHVTEVTLRPGDDSRLPS
jgi:glyoxylase-like metal-dependent hydrolase (beta-lactamase superfamily II)